MCLSAWTGLALNAVGIVRTLLFMFLSKKNQTEKPNKADWISLIVILIVSIIGTILTYETYYSLFALLCCILFTIATWQRSVKVYKILGIGISISGILYSIFVNSIMAVILESVVLMVNIINLIRIYVFKKEINNIEKNNNE